MAYLTEQLAFFFESTNSVASISLVQQECVNSFAGTFQSHIIELQRSCIGAMSQLSVSYSNLREPVRLKFSKRHLFNFTAGYNIIMSKRLLKFKVALTVQRPGVNNQCKINYSHVYSNNQSCISQSDYDMINFRWKFSCVPMQGPSTPASQLVAMR